MIDYRFIGHIGADFVDVTFRTDAISATDGTFNILQVQSGTQFQLSEGGNAASVEDTIYYKYFAGVTTADLSDPADTNENQTRQVFQRKNSTQGDFISFAMTNNLGLATFDEKGNRIDLVQDNSQSASESFGIL